MASTPPKPLSGVKPPQDKPKQPNTTPAVPPAIKTPFKLPIAESKIVESYFGPRGVAISKKQWEDAKFLEKLANELITVITNGTNTAIKLRSQFISMNDLSFATKYFQNASAQARYINILQKHAEAAFAKNMDLNISSWKQHLLSILRNPSIITVYPIVSSAQTAEGIAYKKCAVDINILPLAGSVEDYATAVRYARNYLDYGKQYKGSIGTRMWYTRLWMSGRTPGGHYRLGIFKRVTGRKDYIDNKGRKRSVPVTLSSTKIGSKPNDRIEAKHAEFYWDIMNARMQSMGKKAPYWYILNYGSTVMQGDQGGYAAPPIVPTWFVENAQTEIEAMAYRDLEEHVIWKNASLEKEATWYGEKSLEQVRKIAEALRIIIIELTGGGVYQASFGIAMKYLESNWTPLLNLLEKDAQALQKTKTKMELLANEIIAEMEIGPRLYIKTIKGREIRPRTIALVREISKLIRTSTRTDRTPVIVALEAKAQIEKINAQVNLVKLSKKIAKKAGI